MIGFRSKTKPAPAVEPTPLEKMCAEIAELLKAADERATRTLERLRAHEPKQRES